MFEVVKKTMLFRYCDCSVAGGETLGWNNNNANSRSIPEKAINVIANKACKT